MYSLTSTACVMNPGYSDNSDFDKVFDIFSTQSSISTGLIEYQFGQLGPTNRSLFNYNSQLLNDSYTNITESTRLGYAVSPGYLWAELRAFNATDEDAPLPTSGGNPGSPNNGGEKGKTGSTALAM